MLQQVINFFNLYGVQTSENTLEIKGFKTEFKPEMYG